MIHLLMIADDFTGALDTGVQFAACGIQTRVVVDLNVDLRSQQAQVLVVDTETRHLTAEQAYDIVAGLTKRAVQAGIPYIYKKTDSALRGNIGAELAAVLEAGGEDQIAFLPAFPQTGRITRNGVHYVDGVPVTESPFGKDPFEPVQESVVTRLISRQCSIPVTSWAPLKEDGSVPDEKGILVFDASTVEELCQTGRQMINQGKIHLMAGCAGFATVLPGLLGLGTDEPVSLPRLDPRLLIVCGSVNPITRAQLDLAERAGFSRLRLTPRQKLEPGYWESDEGKQQLEAIERMLASNDHCMIETNDAQGNQLTAEYAAGLGIDLETLRVRIAGSLGHLVKNIFSSPDLGTLLMTGGDTLLHCMNCIGVGELEPLCELEKGVVLSSFTYNGRTRQIITKSGGFGKETLFVDLAGRIGAPQEAPVV